MPNVYFLRFSYILAVFIRLNFNCTFSKPNALNECKPLRKCKFDLAKNLMLGIKMEKNCLGCKNNQNKW